jgi:hypothetical protein
VFVRKVRLKLETASPDWSYIHTHFGVGYRFQPEGPEDAEDATPFETTVSEEPKAAAQAPAEPPEELPPDPEADFGRARSVAGALAGD